MNPIDPDHRDLKLTSGGATTTIASELSVNSLFGSPEDGAT